MSLRPCIVALALGAALAPLPARAETFVNDAAEFRAHTWLVSSTFVLGADREVYSDLEPDFGFDLRFSAQVAIFNRTRLEGWFGFAPRGQVCRDGIATDPPDPFLGCYNLSTGALGLNVRQGLIATSNFHLGAELGASVRKVPASILLAGAFEHADIAFGLPAGAFLLFGKVGAALSETPANHQLDRLTQASVGAEWVLGPFRPVIEVAVSHVWLDFNQPDAWEASGTLGAGYLFE
ncbi:MAG: hypothetical protein JST54_07675 [Deltaproteobacteria bacterium]|nr:hypothetical protein [Deltaproteobacteria bacterium]